MQKEKWLSVVSFFLIFKKIRNFLSGVLVPFFSNLRMVLMLGVVLLLLVLCLWIVLNGVLVLWLHTLTGGWMTSLLLVALLHIILIQILAFVLSRRLRRLQVRLPQT
jgi:hypothetical protein